MVYKLQNNNLEMNIIIVINNKVLFILFILILSGYSINNIQIYPKNPEIGQQFAIFGLTNSSVLYSITLWKISYNSNNTDEKIKLISNICEFYISLKDNTKVDNWFIVPCKCVSTVSGKSYYYLLQIQSSNKSFNEIYRYKAFSSQTNNFDYSNKALSLSYKNAKKKKFGENNYFEIDILNDYNAYYNLFNPFRVQINLIERNGFNFENCSLNDTSLYNNKFVLNNNEYELELRYRPFEMSSHSMFVSNNVNSLIVDYLYDVQDTNASTKLGFGKLISKKRINFSDVKNSTIIEFECWQFIKPGYYAIISNITSVKILVCMRFKIN